MPVPGQSPFAAALEGLLRSVPVTFETFANYLGEPATAAEIHDWIADKSVPSPGQLWRIVSIFRDFRDPEDAAKAERFRVARAEFARVLDERGSHVSPHRFIGSAGKYMLGPLRDALVARLETLPAARQEEAIRQAMKLLNERPESPSDRGIFDPLPD